MSEKHRWTMAEDEHCCKRYVEEYVIRKSNMDMSSFARLLSKELPEIKENSIKMKITNIKQILIEMEIEDTLTAKPLKNYSKQNKLAMEKVLKEMI